jgi:lipopolysaccharide heptosyltransferase II
MRKKKIKDKQKILIIKLGSIGDVIHTLPSLNFLKKSFPNSEISWLIERKSLDIIKDNSDIYRTFIFDRNTKDFFREIKKLRKEKFDWVIDFQGTYKSQLFALLSGAKKRLGYNKTREYLPFSYNRKCQLKTMDRHAVDRNLDLIQFAGAKKTNKIEFKINILEKHKQITEEILKQKGIRKKYCIISASAGKPANRWEYSRFAELADEIAKNKNMDVIFIGTKKDNELNNKIMGSIDSKHVFNLAGELTLKQTAYLLKNSKFLVCGDTGPMHLAVAVSCPVVALFGGSSVVRTGPYQGKNIVVQKQTDCYPCYKKYCKDNVCLKSIHAQEVFKVCENILQD